MRGGAPRRRREGGGLTSEGTDDRIAALEALLRERSQRLADHEAGRSAMSVVQADKVRVEIATLKQSIAYWKRRRAHAP